MFACHGIVHWHILASPGMTSQVEVNSYITYGTNTIIVTQVFEKSTKMRVAKCLILLNIRPDHGCQTNQQQQGNRFPWEPRHVLHFIITIYVNLHFETVYLL